MNVNKITQILCFISTVIIPVATMAVNTTLAYLKERDNETNECKLRTDGD